MSGKKYYDIINTVKAPDTFEPIHQIEITDNNLKEIDYLLEKNGLSETKEDDEPTLNKERVLQLLIEIERAIL